jgi:ankyrin repeat protein
MKQLLITIAAAVLVGCGESQQTTPEPEAKPVAETATPEPTRAKAPDSSIHTVAISGNIEAVRQHIAAGTDVNAKTPQGFTPLQMAAWNDLNEVAELLIANGADVNVKNEDGETLLDWKSMKKEIADLLRKHGGKTGEELKAEGK